MLTTVVLVLCFSCSPGNIVPTEERSRGATVYSAGFCQFSKSYHSKNCVLSPMYHNIICRKIPPIPYFLSSSSCFFSSPPPELRKMFSSPASVPLDKHISSIYYMCIIYFPFPRRKAPHHNPASIFIDSLISASGGFLLQPLLPEVLSGGFLLQPLLPKVLSGGFCFRPQKNTT